MRRDRWDKIKKRISALALPSPPPPAEQAIPAWRQTVSTRRAERAHLRRKNGLHFTPATLSEEHLGALVKLEWLPSDQRENRKATEKALGAYLRSSLVERYANMSWAIAARLERANRTKPARKPSPGKQENTAADNQR